jgi:hypothetical protein
VSSSFRSVTRPRGLTRGSWHAHILFRGGVLAVRIFRNAIKCYHRNPDTPDRPFCHANYRGAGRWLTHEKNPLVQIRWDVSKCKHRKLDHLNRSFCHAGSSTRLGISFRILAHVRTLFADVPAAGLVPDVACPGVNQSSGPK